MGIPSFQGLTKLETPSGAGDLAPTRMTVASYQQVKLIPHISFRNFEERNRMSKSLTAELSRLLTLQA